MESRQKKLDPFATVVEPGYYDVAYESHELRRGVFGRDVLYIRMRIVQEGEHFGKPIWFFLTVSEKGKPRGRSSRVAATYAIATGLRPPKNFWKMNPADYLSGCVFRGKVKTSTKTSDGVEVPALAYSKIVFLVERIAGRSSRARARR